MKNRRFGVEIEFGSGDLGSDGVRRVLHNAFDRAGYRRWNLQQRIGWDGSELELRTPILRGKEGFDKLALVMNTLSDNGCYTTSDDGLHVHHDAPEFTHNIDNCIRLVKSWKANRHLIYKFVNSDRTYDIYEGEGAYWACPGWSDEEISALERNREIPGWSRNDLNLLALREHGSIEIRLHEGTLDYPEAESWIKFGQRFIDRTLKHAMRDSKDVSNLLKKVAISPTAEKKLLNKAGYYKTA